MGFLSLATLRDNLFSILICVGVLIFIYSRRKGPRPPPSQRRNVTAKPAGPVSSFIAISGSIFIRFTASPSAPGGYSVDVNVSEASAILDLATGTKPIAIVCEVASGEVAEVVIQKLHALGFFSRGSISQKDVLFASTTIGKRAIVRQMAPSLYADTDRESLLYMKSTGSKLAWFPGGASESGREDANLAVYKSVADLQS